MKIETTGSTVLPKEATLRRLANSCERLAGHEDQARLTLHDLDANDYRMIARLLHELAAQAPGTAATLDTAPFRPKVTDLVSIRSQPIDII